RHDPRDRRDAAVSFVRRLVAAHGLRRHRPAPEHRHAPLHVLMARRGRAGALIAALLFGFVFVLLAILVVSAVIGAAPQEARKHTDWTTFVGPGIALLAGATVFGVSIRLALTEDDDD